MARSIFTVACTRNSRPTSAPVFPRRGCFISPPHDSARIAGVGSDRGVLAQGRRADIVLIDGNPVERIADLSRTWLVVTQKAVLRPAEIHRSLGMRPFVDDGPAAHAWLGSASRAAEGADGPLGAQRAWGLEGPDRGSPLARIRSATGLHGAGH